MLKRKDANQQVRIVEQNPPDSTFGVGVGFAAIGRRQLLLQLQSVALTPKYHSPLADEAALTGYDLEVAADGATSFVRRAHEAAFGARIEPLADRFVGYGTTQTFIRREHGCMNAHHYPYAPGMSTFIVKCDPATWQRAGRWWTSWWMRPIAAPAGTQTSSSKCSSSPGPWPGATSSAAAGSTFTRAAPGVAAFRRRLRGLGCR